MVVAGQLISAQTGGSEAITSALIAAVVSLLIAVMSQFGVAVRDRTSRRYERRRAALLEAQDAALELRQRLRDYGVILRAHPGQVSGVLTEVEQHFDDARSAFAVAMSRVEDPRSIEALEAWREAASVSFVSVLELSASKEQASWDDLNSAVGSALKSRTGLSED